MAPGASESSWGLVSVVDGLSRPARAAGIALVAVGVIAAGIGTVTLLTGDDGDQTAAPGPSSSAPRQPGPPGGTSATPPEPSASPSVPPSRSTSRPAPPSASASPGSPPPPGAGDGTGGPGDQRVFDKSVGVRVYNNSTIEDLAHRAAADLRRQGWNVVQVNNYSSGIIPATTAYYRPGTGEEAAAKALATEFGMRAEPRFDGIKDASAGVIVIVTKNYHAPEGKTSG